MADTDYPDVKQFTVMDANGRNKVEIYIGPQVGMIATTKWPVNDKGVVNGVGESQTITMGRHSLIGLAYEILKNVH